MSESGTAPAARSGKKGEKSRYRSTLNLPKTTFPMKANLVQNEPASLKRWKKMGLYERVQEARRDAPGWTFHDGPPYANASIHLGHLMNKCMKDFVVRSRTMMGFRTPFVPGWDCHGLPIEHMVMTGLAQSGKLDKLASLPADQRRMAVRRECQTHASKCVKLHTGQMERLLTLADYEHPYLTMTPQYEGAVLDVFADLVSQGLVYRALKSVHWSIANETALADAELEYKDREDISVYVDFECADPADVYEAFGVSEDDRPGVTPSLMIWTTTPWTLPANVAVAVNPRYEYALAEVDGNVTILATDLLIQVAKAGNAEDVKVLATAKGSALLGLRYKHPFINGDPKSRDPEHGPFLVDLSNPASVRNSITGGAYSLSSDGALEHNPTAKKKVYTVVAADYVTLEDGTGLVHTATGHGVEDYQTGVREGLPVYCPVLMDGKYDKSTPDWLQGKSIWEANTLVTERLRQSGHLFHDHTFMHSYPHDWRSKTPVIFRATEQWFVAVDRAFHHVDDPVALGPMTLRRRALDAIGFDPENPQTAEQLRILKEASEEERRESLARWAAEERGESFSRPAAPPEVAELNARWDYLSQRRIEFIPKWGRNRMRGMLESRPDWCISRQRAWGLPIPAFFNTEGESLLTTASVRAVADVVRAKGSDAWFQLSPEDLLANYDPTTDPDVPDWLKSQDSGLETLVKGEDIFDVWFESGSSWHAVVRDRDDAGEFPIELYLEGSDQHRGWFQLSLLPSLGVTGRPPYKRILTHGFMVDKDGHKLSKSKGDTVEDLFRDYGSDVLRWWVLSLSYENDIKVDRSFFDNAGESYRKVRNTLRFMLSNLGDFEPSTGDREGVDLPSFPPTSLDAWVLGEFETMASGVVEAYETFDYQQAHRLLYNFCNDTLSAVYLAAVKDRLYCDAPDSPRRRRTQTTLWELTDGLCRLLAPVLCHTADEAWRALRGVDPKDAEACVHTTEFVRSFGVSRDDGFETLMKVRDDALLALERAKAQPGIENPLDAGLVLPDPQGILGRLDPVDVADLMGVSRVRLDPGASGVSVEDLREEPRCERSWKRDGTVRERSDGGLLSDRDAGALGIA